jgi:hypothetical protein
MPERCEGTNERALGFAQYIDDDLILGIVLGELGAVLLSMHDDEDVVSSSFAGIHNVEDERLARYESQRLGWLQTAALPSSENCHTYRVHLETAKTLGE